MTLRPFIITIANEKGGVAKTTTAVSLGGALVEAGKTVLLIDLDTQCDLTVALGINPVAELNSIHGVFFDGKDINSLTIETGIPRLFLLPANSDLLELEKTLITLHDEGKTLREQLHSETQKYDFIVLDCPPHLGPLTMNALIAADLIIMPTQAEYFSIYALRSMMKIVKELREKVNPNLTYRLLITEFDGRNRIHRMMSEHLQRVFGSGVLTSQIEIDTKLRESQIAGIPIVFHSPDCRSAMQYRSLSQEILNYAQEKV